MKIGITGIRGKMAKALALEIIGNSLFDISGALVRQGYDEVGDDIGDFLGLDKKTNSIITDDINMLFEDSDAVIDFSSPELTMECAEVASKKKKILVSGTNGLTLAQKDKLKALASNSVIVHSENMSIGANLLLNLTEETALLLNEDYDTEILEFYGRGKNNSPSSTSLMLGKAIANGRSIDFGEATEKIRGTNSEARIPNEIGFGVLRGGDTAGENMVIFAGAGERIELTHKTTSPLIFINGAIRATIWASGQKNGFFTMRDVMKVENNKKNCDTKK